LESIFDSKLGPKADHTSSPSSKPWQTLGCSFYPSPNTQTSTCSCTRTNILMLLIDEVACSFYLSPNTQTSTCSCTTTNVLMLLIDEVARTFVHTFRFNLPRQRPIYPPIQHLRHEYNAPCSPRFTK
jgi:hypothetical protein